MTAELAHLIVSGLLAIGGLLAIVFAVLRGRKVGAGAAFGLGGLILLLYAGSFAFTYKVSRSADTAGMAEAAGRKSELTEFVRRAERASFPVAVLEPVALLLLMLGFGALARASDARQTAAADTPEFAGVEEEEAFAEVEDL